MDSKIIEELAKPVAVAFKPGPGGMKYKYVKGDDVINRLNKAFEYEWSSQVMNTFKDETQIIAHVKLTGGGVSKEGFGGAEIAVYSSGPKQGKPVDISNAYKSAVTNGIKKAAEQFGIGLTPESDDDDGPGSGGSTGGYKPNPPQTFKAPEPPKAPVVNNVAPVSGGLNIRTVPVVNPVPPVVVSPPVAVSKPVMQSNIPNTNTSFNGVDLAELKRLVDQKMRQSAERAAAGKVVPVAQPVNAPVLSASDVGALVAPILTMSPTTPAISAAVPAHAPVMNTNVDTSMFPQSGNDDEIASDVQVQALNGLVRMKKISEIEAITQCISNSPKSSFKSLTMGEARTIIRVLQTPVEGSNGVVG